MKPFLKWAGNKYAIVERIKALLPEAKRLVEPFAGASAVFMNTNYPRALITDSNADLIGLYMLLQKEGEGFISACAELFVPENNRAEAFYAFRAEFNATRNRRRKAVLFLYLNRHGYNGLCRYNAKGGFNVPFGRYAKPYFPATEMRAFYEKAKSAEFKVADFRDVMRAARIGDVVYCDPPYVPLSRTANFTSYGPGGFTQKDQEDLAILAAELSARGIPVIISNHDTAFTVQAYRHADDLQRMEVRRFISRNGSNRGKAKEILALFNAVG